MYNLLDYYGTHSKKDSESKESWDRFGNWVRKISEEYGVLIAALEYRNHPLISELIELADRLPKRSTFWQKGAELLNIVNELMDRMNVTNNDELIELYMPYDIKTELGALERMLKITPMSWDWQNDNIVKENVWNIWDKK